MNSRAGRITVLYGMYVIFSGAIGILTEESVENMLLYALTAAGLIAVYIGGKLKNGNSGMLSAALVVVGAIMLLCVWQCVHGWLDLAAGQPTNLLLTLLLTLLTAFAAITLPVVNKALQRQKRLEKLLEQ